MTPPILILRNINLTFGGTPLFKDAELSISEGECLCLVGRNGSGKSTLLKIAAGLIEPDTGEIFLQPGKTLRYLPQEPEMGKYNNILAYVKAGLAPGDDPNRASYLLAQLSLNGEEKPSKLSGGEKRRCALARVLSPEPDILLLDEPTNHLDLPAIEWLESELQTMRTALILISHDRRFLKKLSNRTVWLTHGTTRTLREDFNKFEEWRDTILEQEMTERSKLDRKLLAETEWLRKGVTARRKRNQGRLRSLIALRKKRRDQRGPAGQVIFSSTKTGQSGKFILETKSISKTFDQGPIIKNFSIKIKRGDRIGIVGPNGAGKTTLINLITGSLEPDEGSIRLGTNLDMITLDQNRERLDPNSTLANALTGGGEIISVGDKNKHVIGYMKDFLFSPEQARTPVRVLSGGERGRVMLARALAQPSNFLILDEPTNDLDIETLDLLQEMIANYKGTIILISHDRDFLDRTTTSIICSEGNGNWVEYAGGYSDMLLQRGIHSLEKNKKSKDSRPKDKKKELKTASSTNKIKMSYKDKYALETLPHRMKKMRELILKHQTILSDSDLFLKDARSYEKSAKTIEVTQSELEEAEEQWLELEILREQAEKN